ncbi:MAG: ABC transporter ATP-binding protein [Clostridiales bacterium]|nr:ABC transporter ATP-binding protein [Clostridiales bacterium]
MPKKKNNAVRWIYDVPGRSRLYVVLLMILQTAYGGTGVFYALLMKEIVDSAVAGDKGGFITSILLIVGLIIIMLILYVFINRFSELARAKIENKFKGRLFDNILRKDYSRVTAVHSGEWINRMTNDAVLIANGAVEILPSLSGMIIRLISAIVMIFIVDWHIAAIMIPAGIFVGFLAYVFRKKLKAMHKNVQETDGRFRVFLQENIASLIMIRSFQAQEQTSDELDVKMTEHKNARMRKNRFSTVMNAGFSFAMNGMYFLGIFYGGWGILTGAISYGTLMMLTQLISQLQGPIVTISGMIPRIYTITASAERLMEIEDFGDGKASGTFHPEEISEYYHNHFRQIGLRNVDFTYYSASEDMPQVLNNVTLSVDKGDYVAFTGHSGCGKSTTLKLLMGIYSPDSGQIYAADDRGESDINGIAGSIFAYVPQGNLLMSGTIRDVVCFADKSRRDDIESINRALEIACAKEFTDGLDDGIDTVLGERGTGLSEGQMQRLAIARAIFSDRPILLLDEATSALDDRTEEQLLTNLRNMTDRTVVIITHRPAALRICDKVMDFGPGGVIENS